MQSNVQSLAIILLPLPCLADSSEEPGVGPGEWLGFCSSSCDQLAYWLVFMLGPIFRYCHLQSPPKVRVSSSLVGGDYQNVGIVSLEVNTKSHLFRYD